MLIRTCLTHSRNKILKIIHRSLLPAVSPAYVQVISLFILHFPGERLQNCHNEERSLDVTYFCSNIEDKVSL